MNKRPLIGIGVLIFRDQEILLGKRQNTYGQATWGPPDGHLEFGENFEECAIREVFEETGLILTNTKFLSLTNDIFTQEEKHYVSIFLTAACPINQVVKNCEPEKVEEWRWFDLDNLPSNLFLPLQQLVNDRGYGKRLVNRRLDY
jgi:8-oxo-dGTP diphosphatase